MPSNRLKINCIVNVTTSWYEPLSKRTLNIVKEEKRGKIRVHIKNVKIETSKTEGFSWQKLVVHLCIYNTLAVWRHESWHELRHDFRHNRIRIYEGRNQDEEKKKPHLKHATREWCHIKPKIVMEQEWFCRIKFVRNMKVRAIGRCFLLIPRFFSYSFVLFDYCSFFFFSSYFSDWQEIGQCKAEPNGSSRISWARLLRPPHRIQFPRWTDKRIHSNPWIISYLNRLNSAVPNFCLHCNDQLTRECIRLCLIGWDRWIHWLSMQLIGKWWSRLLCLIPYGAFILWIHSPWISQSANIREGISN